MDACSMWVNDLLIAANNNSNPDTIKMLEKCGEQCAVRKNAIAFFSNLSKETTNFQTRAEYVNFLREKMQLNITEESDGIVMRLGKTHCTCPMMQNMSGNLSALCNCTCGHEKACWSVFFGKPVEVEIVESYLRGGNDCVIKIKV